MRNWNTITALSSKAVLKVASLPMRNWNHLFKFSLVFASTVASLPMRNWNSWVANLFTPCFNVASLPMRNWNLFQYNSFTFLVTQLRAYLWGIETFQRLTHSLVMLLCCEPTYEELKRNKPMFAPYFVFSCEPTYEELKPTFTRKRSQVQSVASLPMRNWNCGNLFKFLSGSELRAYLWGIETGLTKTYSVSSLLCCEPTYEELKHGST